MIMNINTIFLALPAYLYGFSLIFNNLQPIPGFSGPYLIALCFMSYKVYDLIKAGRFLKFDSSGYWLGLFCLYMLFSEYYLHHGVILNDYYISLALNIAMLLMLVDEYRLRPSVRRIAMLLFLVGFVILAIIMTTGVINNTSSTGRISIFDQNPNDLAAAMLIAYCWILIEYLRNTESGSAKRTLLLICAFFPLNAIVVTGTRFALVGVVISLLIMLSSVIVRRTVSKGVLALILLNGTFLIFRLLSFAPASERLMPSVSGNNLSDLGGRVPLWRLAYDSFVESPLFGVGYGGFELHTIMREGLFLGLPHFFLLEVAVIAGLAGVVLLVIAGFFILRDSALLVSGQSTQELLIWLVPLFIIMTMLNISQLKVFWFALALFLTHPSASRARKIE